VFVAGGAGAIGRALLPVLVAAGHQVAGTTRRPERADAIRAIGAHAVTVDVLDRDALVRAVVGYTPDVVVHQLTALGDAPSADALSGADLERNARIRVEGTDNLMAAAMAVGVTRVIAQSIAWVYAPGVAPRVETDPLLPDGPSASITLHGVHSLEARVLGQPGIEGVVLRYGRLYGPATWTLEPGEPPTVSVEAAARAAVLALTRGAPGVYNIVDDAGPVSNARARRELGWEPA
jgi:nucleoside-diphosphate-sugar epimerase